MIRTQSTKNSSSKEPQTRHIRGPWRWPKKIILYTLFSLVVNHLATRESFPGSEQYRFPIEGFLYSMALCILIGTIAELNFNYYKKKYFATKVEVVTISRFMLTTLGYVTLLYVPLSIVVDSIVGGETAFYYLLIGLLITLLLSFILIGLAYAQDIYYLYKHSIKDAEITIESGVKTTKITYENIACFYSENKVVYTVQNDGSTLSTNFTLNELEEKINDQLFFRANRQMIIHKEAVGQVEKIQNGKLRVRLKLPVGKHIIDPITISRYKRQAFINWFQ